MSGSGKESSYLTIVKAWVNKKTNNSLIDHFPPSPDQPPPPYTINYPYSNQDIHGRLKTDF